MRNLKIIGLMALVFCVFVGSIYTALTNSAELEKPVADKKYKDIAFISESNHLEIMANVNEKCIHRKDGSVYTESGKLVINKTRWFTYVDLDTTSRLELLNLK